MPFIVPAIKLIGGLFGGGGDSPKPADPTKLTPLTTAQNDAQKALVTQQLPNLQALTGGSLSPEYAAGFGATKSGLSNDPQASGNIQAAINQFFGLTSPGTTGFTPGTSSGSGNPLMDFISKTPTPGTTGGGGNNFVNDQLNSDIFKGLAG